MSTRNSLVKNSLYNVSYKLLNIIFPLVSATYTARVILASGVGEVSFAQNVVSYFTTIAALGIPNYGIREIAKVRGKIEETNKVFSELFFINSLSTILCSIVYLFLIFSFNSFFENISMYCAVGLSLIFNFLNIDWFYQGKEDYAYITKRSFVIKVISLFSLFVFVRNTADAVNYALISSLAIGGNNIFNLVNLKNYNIRLRLKNIEIKKHLKPIFLMLGSVIAIEIYTMLDTTMIGSMVGTAEVGYYTNSMKLVKLLITVITAIGGVLLPRLSEHHSKGEFEKLNQIVDKVFKIMLFLFLPAQIAIYLLAPIIVPILFGDSFLPAIFTLQISSFLICTLGFSNLFGTQILLTFSEERKLLISTILGAVSNVILNLFLIPIMGQNGAALASVVSEMLVTLAAYNYASKHIKLKFDTKFYRATIVSSVIMGVVIFGIMQLSIGNFGRLLISALLGIIVFFSINILMKNPIISDLSEIVKRRKS
ncbi:flippase [Streptococcus parasanguinis]|uniref:flippase n=1 Tax=Streptococcus parasanguinis TaxID=1318 RepID=UPI0022834A67|nr:flippase [Streptococcus parasanguinis]MCY7050964.1 flippase [Streptococcus parasanguinis]